MHRAVEEDWSFFNQAVRDRAMRKPAPDNMAAHKVKRFPDGVGASAASGNLVAPPGSSHQQPNLIDPVIPPPKPIPISEDRMVRYILRFLVLVAAAIALYALLASAVRSDASRPTIVTGTGSGTVAGPVSGTGTGSADAAVTNYTQFNKVAFGDWSVVTGWNYDHSGDALPTNQYCYLEKKIAGGGSWHFELEARSTSFAGLPNKRPNALVPGLSDEVWTQAATKCRWHR